MNLSNSIKQTSLALMLFMSISGCSKTVEPEEIMNVKKMALNGYDPVSYFDDSKSAQGGMAFSYTYKDLQWYFGSKKNLKIFKAEPEAYIPQFGGFCSYAIADKNLVLSNPAVWYIHNKKLYLFEDVEAKDKWFTQMNTFIDEGQMQYDIILNPVQEVEASPKDTTQSL